MLPSEREFTPTELAVIHQGEAILQSGEFARLIEQATLGLPAECRVAGHTIVFEPGLPHPYLAITLFGEQGFVLGPSALASTAELFQTVMHELFRLHLSAMLPTRGATVGGAQADETDAAHDFARRALNRTMQGRPP